MKKQMKNNKGITLIALVITIIVLLILAGVSIAMLTGDNGLLTKASKSKTETLKAEAIERVNIELNAQMANAMAGDDFDVANTIASNIGTANANKATLQGGYEATVNVTEATDSTPAKLEITLTGPETITTPTGSVEFNDTSKTWKVTAVK